MWEKYGRAPVRRHRRGPVGTVRGACAAEGGHRVRRLRGVSRCRRPLGHREPALDDVRVGAPHLVADDDRVRRVPDGLGLPTTRATARSSAYFRDFADHFGLTERFRFDTRVTAVERDRRRRHGCCAPTGPDGAVEQRYDGVILANGTLAEPNVPAFRGEFTGEILHTSAYKSATQLTGKRVLIIGAGNSGCDIAVDAVHHAASVDMSVRRGYYFVPRYLFGKPSDTLNQGKPLPARIKQFVDTRVLQAFTGDPVRFGFPKPDYKIYESHPIVNTLILNHLGQGDLRIRADIDRFDGSTVHFRDGSSGEYDMVLLATGYTLDYPFVARDELNWTGWSPTLFLNVFPPSFNGLYVMGMIEASGIGWQGRYEQAELIAVVPRGARSIGPSGSRLPPPRGRRAVARPHRRLQVPRPRAHVVLRQQGRLPPRRARRDRGG